MNRFVRVILCSMLVSAPALASAQGNAGQMGSGPMMNQEQMQQMHQNMSQMQGMMQEMSTLDSPAKRAEMREKHMEAMQQHMQMMRSHMTGPGMMMNNGGHMMGSGQGMSGDNNRQKMMMDNQGKQQPGKAGGDRSGKADLSDEKRLEMMESRLNQMQLMMEQMLKHESLKQGQ